MPWFLIKHFLGEPRKPNPRRERRRRPRTNPKRPRKRWKSPKRKRRKRRRSKLDRDTMKDWIYCRLLMKFASTGFIHLSASHVFDFVAWITLSSWAWLWPVLKYSGLLRPRLGIRPRLWGSWLRRRRTRLWLWIAPWHLKNVQLENRSFTGWPWWFETMPIWHLHLPCGPTPRHNDFRIWMGDSQASNLYWGNVISLYSTDIDKF